MTIEQAIADRLVADAAVTAIVSTRVRQLFLRQSETFPAIRVQLIDEPAESHLRGLVNLYRARVQIDAYVELTGGDAYGTAGTLADAIHEALIGAPWSSSGSPGEIDVLLVDRQSRMPMYEPEELRLVRMMQDFYVWFRNV